jgi:hypothetical protein
MYRVIRSEDMEALRTIYELIKLTMLSYKYLLQIVLLLTFMFVLGTLYKHYLVCIDDYFI